MARMTVNRLSFIGGSLAPKGTVVDIPDELLKPRSERSGARRADDSTRARNSNLSPVGKRRATPEIEIAAIGPTGPNPTKPQQLPPGTITTGAGSFNDGNRLVAEGTRVTSLTDDTGTVEDDDVEIEEADLAFAEDEAEDEELAQVAQAVVEGTVEEVEKAVVGLSAAELDAVEKAEADGRNRAGVANAIKAARAGLAE